MKFKSCESCLVYGSDRKPLARARVVELREHELQLYFLTKKLRSVRLKAIVDFYDGYHGLVRCLCDMLLKENPLVQERGEPWTAKCRILKIYETQQRQKDIRVKTQISLNFRVDDGRSIFGSIQNISAGGMYFVTSQELKEGQSVTFEHRFKSEPKRVRAKVLRKRELNGGYGYGCQFPELLPDEEADVRNFVYVKQIQKQLELKKQHDLLIEEGL